MQAVGIIAEYNPFHNGHKWHLEQARELSGHHTVVAVMSGNFVQRGEPALVDKWVRAQMAVSAGVDLVLELPTVFAVRSAEHFSAGGIRLLGALGVIDSVCFGAEHPDISALTALARSADEPETIEILKEHLEAGDPYAAAMGKALGQRTGVAPEIIASPNNILAIEYVRAILRYAPSLKPLTIGRREAGYHDIAVTGTIASATAIRQELKLGSPGASLAFSAMPATCAEILDSKVLAGDGPLFYRDFGQMVLAKLRSTSLSSLEQLPDVKEGLHYKIKDSALQATTIDEFFEKTKSKRYSRTRLQRIAIHALLGSREEQFNEFDRCGPLYARILAFSDRGRSLLRRLRGKATIPVITKTTQYLNSAGRDAYPLTPLEAMLAVDTLATDLYVLARPNPVRRQGGLDFRTSPLYLPYPPATV